MAKTGFDAEKRVNVALQQKPTYNCGWLNEAGSVVHRMGEDQLLAA